MKKILALIIFCSCTFIFANAQTVGIKITTSGDVGIGTATPLEKLDVDGGIRVGNTTTTNAGTIRWNGNCFEGYDGTAWLALSAGCGGSGPTCSDGIQNQGETGVDCGGPCAPCSSGGCESFPDILAARDLPNSGWNNEYNVGGTGITGDGELYFKVDYIDGNTDQVVGLSDNPTSNANKSSVDFSIRIYAVSTSNTFRYAALVNGSLESAWINGSSASHLEANEFSIERNGTTINYKINNVVFHTLTSSNTNTLYFDNSFFDKPTGSIWGVRPSECHITNIDLCPAGSSPTAPTNATSAQGQIDESQVAPEPIQLYKIELSNNNDSYLSTPTPNPFSDRTTVTFAIVRDYFEAELIFSDSYGRELGRKQIETGQGVIEIESAGLDSGIYQYSLLVDGEIVKTNKMVIVK